MSVSQALSVTETSYSVANNTSVVRISWTSTQSGSSYNNYTKTAYYYVSVNGGTETAYPVTYTLPMGTTRTIVDTSITVSHNSSGSGYVSVRTWLDTGISAGVVQLSQTEYLTNIPRATTPTISGTKALGSSITINTPRASSSFTHRLYYTWGSQYTDVQIASSVGTSYAWTIPKTLSETIMGATSGTMSIKCVTYNGSSVVGTKSVSFTVTVPDTAEFKPVINSITATNADGGEYVQGISRLLVTVNSTGAYVNGSQNRNSYPVSATVNVDGTTYTKTLGQSAAATWSITTDVLSEGMTKVATVVVTDSRGRQTTATTTVSVYGYAPPIISSFTARRCLSNGTLSDSGTYLLIQLAATVSSVGNTNAKNYRFVYVSGGNEITIRSGTLSQYTNATVSLNTYSVGRTFSIDYAWTVKCYVIDSYNAESPAVSVVNVPTEATFMDWRTNGNGLAFGKVSERDALEVAWPIYDRNNFGVGITSKQIGGGYGHILYESGVLIQWGTVAITPTAAGVVTTATITFPRAYAATPHIGGNVLANYPQTITWGIGGGTTSAATLTGMFIYMTRTNVNATTFRWWAIGQKA